MDSAGSSIYSSAAVMLAVLVFLRRRPAQPRRRIVTVAAGVIGTPGRSPDRHALSSGGFVAGLVATGSALVPTRLTMWIATVAVGMALRAHTEQGVAVRLRLRGGIHRHGPAAARLAAGRAAPSNRQIRLHWQRVPDSESGQRLAVGTSVRLWLRPRWLARAPCWVRWRRSGRLRRVGVGVVGRIHPRRLVDAGARGGHRQHCPDNRCRITHQLRTQARPGELGATTWGRCWPGGCRSVPGANRRSVWGGRGWVRGPRLTEGTVGPVLPGPRGRAGRQGSRAEHLRITRSFSGSAGRRRPADPGGRREGPGRMASQFPAPRVPQSHPRC